MRSRARPLRSPLCAEILTSKLEAADAAAAAAAAAGGPGELPPLEEGGEEGEEEEEDAAAPAAFYAAFYGALGDEGAALGRLLDLKNAFAAAALRAAAADVLGISADA